MRLNIIVLSLLLVLFPGVVLGQGSDSNGTASDDAPGWLVVFAGSDDAATQQNVIRACMVANFVWRLPTDHVLVLARGADVDSFVKGGDLPKEMGVDGNKAFAAPAPPGFKPSKTEDLLDGAGSIGGAFKVLFHTNPSSFFSYSGDATAENFRIGRDVLARVAQPGQFIAFLTIANGESIAGSKSGFFLTPHPGDTGKKRLSADDFKLTDCRASVRMVMLGGSTTAASEAPDFSALADSLAAGGDKDTISAVFANWAVGAGAVNAYIAQLLRHLQSANYDRTTLQEIQDYSSRDSLQDKSQLRPQSLKTTLGAAFCLKRVPVEANIVRDKQDPVDSVLSKDSYFGNVSDITIGGNTVLSLPGAGNLSPENRGDIIKARIVEFMERLKSDPDAILKIKIQPEADGSWGLYTDDGKKLVNADPNAAKLLGVTSRELVADLETHFKTACYKFLHQGTGYPEKLASEWYMSGKRQYNLQHWSKAASYYALAVKRLPTYTVAHFGLIDSLAKDGRKAEAAAALKRLMALKLDAQDRSRVKALRLRTGL